MKIRSILGVSTRQLRGNNRDYLLLIIAYWNEVQLAFASYNTAPILLRNCAIDYGIVNDAYTKCETSTQPVDIVKTQGDDADGADHRRDGKCLFGSHQASSSPRKMFHINCLNRISQTHRTLPSFR